MRNFLKSLGNDVLDVEEEVSANFEIASYMRRSCDIGGPVLNFKNIPGYPRRSVVGPIFGTKERVKRILSSTPLTDFEATELYTEMADRAYNTTYVPTTVESEEAPCHEVIKLGNLADLDEIPICTYNEKDKGPFITSGVQVVKWVDGKTHGLGIHRCYKIDKNTISCLAPKNRRVGHPHFEASKVGAGIKMAIVLGGPPAITIASQAKLPVDKEKYALAEHIMGERIPMVKCQTSDILVPADSEMVLECESIPSSEFDDTMFLEYPGTYSCRTTAFKLKVVAITHRRDYTFPALLTGAKPNEDCNLCAYTYASEVLRVAKKYAKVTDISTHLGNSVFSNIVCIEKTPHTDVAGMMQEILDTGYNKSIAVLDSDLSATEEDWRFAFDTRFQAETDLLVTGLQLGASLDPSSPEFQYTSKIGFDCTCPVSKNQEEMDKIRDRHVKGNTIKLNIDSSKWPIGGDYNS